jgi:hypothetical protein
VLHSKPLKREDAKGQQKETGEDHPCAHQMTSGPKYEMWRLKGPDGVESYHILPVGRLAPEFQKFGERVPMTPMEAGLMEAKKLIPPQK